MKSKRKKTVANMNGAITKQDIRILSDKIERNQKALDKLDTVSTKIDKVTVLISKNQNALDQLEDVGRIIRENEENLKNLGTLQHRLDTLDKIMISVDKIAGEIQTYRQEQTIGSNSLSNHEDRLETIEKHLNLPAIA